jgi:hypothetical protein
MPQVNGIVGVCKAETRLNEEDKPKHESCSEAHESTDESPA